MGSVEELQSGEALGGEEKVESDQVA